VPYLTNCVPATGAILAGGSHDQIRTLLPRIASGNTILTPAWIEPDNRWSATWVQMRATADGHDYVLEGTKMHVDHARAGDLMVVPGRVGRDRLANRFTTLGASQPISHYLTDAKTNLDGAKAPVCEAAPAQLVGHPRVRTTRNRRPRFCLLL